MSNKFFLSHSSKNKEITLRIAEELRKENVWIDMWDLEAGKVLPQEIAQGIEGAGYFVLIASQESMKSNWVRFELNLALVRWIEEKNISLVVVKIDDCVLHPELRLFLYKDCSHNPEEAIQAVVSLAKGENIPERTSKEATKERIINRFNELQALEDLSNEGFKAIVLWGIYGIGKSALVEKAAKSVFNRQLELFNITESHAVMRLSFELCARAQIKLPEPDSSTEVLFSNAVEAIQILQKKGKLIVFKEIENQLNEDNDLKQLWIDLLHKINLYDHIPIIFTSTRSVNIPIDLSGQLHSMRINPLDEKHLTFCLDRWIKLSDPSSDMKPETLTAIAQHLNGYPLAAKLAAPLIATHGGVRIITDLRHLTNLRIDMAKQLIGRTRAKLSDIETGIMEILTVDDTGVTAEEIAEVLNITAENVRDGIDNLTKASLLKSEGTYLSCHPLIRDYVWQRAYDSGNWIKISSALGLRAKKQIEKISKDGISDQLNWVHLCTKAYRLLIMSGNVKEADSLIVRFEDEIRGVGHRLYHARQYSIANQYLDLWVNAHQYDHESRLLRARCSTRLKKYPEAWSDLEILDKHNFSKYKLHHARGLWYRDQEKYAEAIDEFRKGRDLRGNYLPLLRDLGDMLARIGELSEAREVLELAYNMARNDRFIVPKYADVLEQCGLLDQALVIAMRVADAFPDEATFQHRIAVLLSKDDRDDEAIQYARRAVELDPSTVEHVLHCASVEVRQGFTESAEERLKALPGLQGRPLLIKDTVLAGIALSKNDVALARKLLSKYRPEEDQYIAELVGRICYTEAATYHAEGKYPEARERLTSGLSILENSKWNDNKYMANTVQRIHTLLDRVREYL